MKENFKKNIKEYTIITLGYVILAIAIKFFLAPNKIANGGITGVAIIVNYFIPKLSVGLLMVILNGALFILAFSAIDGEFGARTVYASMGLSILRSEEHTSELQSRQYLVCRLLLEKKKKKLFIHKFQAEY